MPVFVVGLNHCSALLDLLERLAIDLERRPKALAMLLEREHVKEGAILSTCNRVEIYAEIDRFHDGGDAVRGFLTEFHCIRSHELSDYLYAHYEDRAVNHLFAVTAGIDSMVVGEVQILGQVREAFQAAQAERSVGPVLHALFTQALRVGRRARHETAIGQGLASTLSVSLQVAEGQLGTLAGRGVLIVGAGKMAKLASRSVREAGASDLVIASTAAITPTVTLAAVRQLPGVVLADLDALRAVLETGDDGPRHEVERVRVLIGEETAGFMSGQRSAKLAPTIRALRARAEGVRQQELARASTRLAGLDPAQRAAVDAVTRGLVNKLLHDPIVRGKALAAGANGETYAGILRQLYALDEEDRRRDG